ncbi:MAG TPA: hypothetical protein VMI54_22235 [Polyangiaceae bacterium]|nr:hypothetical protein [Polyangiaceae bacterium]
MRAVAFGCVALLLCAPACSKQKSETAAAAPSGSLKPAAPLPAPVASGLPDPELVSSFVNPNKEKPYAGPTGTVRGRVVAKGDAAIDLPQILAKIPATCPDAKSTYGKLFREGPDRSLPDVLVAVTGYNGYVPEKEPAQRVEAKDCVFATRTLALTFGQRIDVVSGDKDTYIPELLGEHGQPQIVATPHAGTASPLYPTHIGRFALIDDLKLFMTADVYVVKFATHAVTGMDGRFEITGVPVGAVHVNALLPATGATAYREVSVTANKPTDEIVFELGFDAADYAKRSAGAPPSASAAATASASASATATGKGAPSAKAHPLPAPRPSAH